MLTTAAPVIRTAMGPSATAAAGRAARTQPRADRDDVASSSSESVVSERPAIAGVVEAQRYRQYLVGKAALSSATMAAVMAPPLYLLYAARRGFSLRAALRASWAFPLVGGLAGASSCAYNIAKQHPMTTFHAAEKLRVDVSRVRTEDCFLVGASIGALAIPALFGLRRVGLMNGLFGGASMGGAAGVLYDLVSRVAPMEGEVGQPASVFASPSSSAAAPTL